MENVAKVEIELCDHEFWILVPHINQDHFLQSSYILKVQYYFNWCLLQLSDPFNIKKCYFK